MKKFLAISHEPPMPDQASGDLRFFSILELLGKLGEVTLAVKDINTWRKNNSNSKNYEAMYLKAGINLSDQSIYSVLTADKFDLLIFEFYYTAHEFLDMARYFQPHALLIVDSVDVHFNRLLVKAALTGYLHDEQEAKRVQSIELNTYKKADVIIAVSEDDKSILQKALPNAFISVLPNVHEIHKPTTHSSREFGRLIFIGGFAHSPNVDAVLYFLNEVMPLIRAKSTDVKLSIIGSNVPQEIIDMAAVDVEIIGYVEDTAPYLQSAYISIAPLRYGGGMKGKVGEAMSHGLPVVTTRFGAEGFGLIEGKDLLVAETPEAFADAILKLLSDSDYYKLIGENGYEFIKKHYSPETMQQQLACFLENTKNISPKSSHWHERFLFHLKLLYERHISWRLKK